MEQPEEGAEQSKGCLRCGHNVAHTFDEEEGLTKCGVLGCACQDEGGVP